MRFPFGSRFKFGILISRASQIVTTGKAFKAAKQDGTASLAEVAAMMETRIPTSMERFNWALDDLECDIVGTFPAWEVRCCEPMLTGRPAPGQGGLHPGSQPAEGEPQAATARAAAGCAPGPRPHCRPDVAEDGGKGGTSSWPAGPSPARDRGRQADRAVP